MDWQNEYTGFCYGENYRGILAERGQKVVIGKDHKPKVVRQFGDSKELAKVIKKHDWNEYDIIAVGNQIIQKINGQLMCVVTDEDTVARKAGIIALQLHAGRPMKVQFRNIRLQELFGKVAGTRHWEIVFAKGNTPDLYARQLDFFGIEIGIVKPGGKIDYAFHLSQPKPDTRTTSEVEDETRYWLRWPDVDEEARKLVEKAGLDPGSGALLKFIPRETELKLCTLEQTMAGPQRSKNIKRTRLWREAGRQRIRVLHHRAAVQVKAFEAFTAGQLARGRAGRLSQPPIMWTFAKGVAPLTGKGGRCKIGLNLREGTRMVSSLTRNQVRRKPLRVRLPCPPLIKPCGTISYARLFRRPPIATKWGSAAVLYAC